MAFGTLLHFVIGAILKLITSKIARGMEMDREIKMAALNRDENLIKATQAGADTADWSLRVLRFLVVLPFVYMFLWLAFYAVTTPDLRFDIPVAKHMSPFWGFLLPFPINSEGFMYITSGTILWKMWDGVWLIIGFVATKFGK